MSWLWAVAGVVLALAGQSALAQVWPEADRYVDLMLVPVVWCAIARSQRAAMLVGCAGGLLADAWFQLAPFGTSGFKKTLVAWVLGGIASRFDLDQPAGRLVAGTLAGLAQALLGPPLAGLLGQPAHVPGPLELLGSALTTGLAVLFVGNALERPAGRRAVRHPA